MHWRVYEQVAVVQPHERDGRSLVVGLREGICRIGTRTGARTRSSISRTNSKEAIVALVSSSSHDDPGTLDPIQGVLEILERASMTGTNKLGLLLVLLDFAPERTEGDQSISKKDLATRYLDIHWGARPSLWRLRTSTEFDKQAAH